jgi:hypothetical protein
VFRAWRPPGNFNPGDFVGFDRPKVIHRPKLLSDNGASYISADLAKWLDGQNMEYVRGAPYHLMTLAANKTSRLVRDYLNQAGKLSRICMLLDALNRHRGKGQQKIMVEHVHVHSGGQAVVGIVEAPGGGVQPKSANQPNGKGQPAHIAHAPQPAMRSADKARDNMPVASGRR